MYERLIRRILWTAACTTCDRTWQWTERPPKSVLCPTCNVWYEPKKEEWTGPEKL